MRGLPPSYYARQAELLAAPPSREQRTLECGCIIRFVQGRFQTIRCTEHLFKGGTA